MEADPRRVITWVLTIVVPILATAALAGILRFLPKERMALILEQHFAAVVGLPLAALLAAFIVVALRFSDGPIKFKGVGFEFEGASGQVILWVICFLSISASIRMLWGV